MATFVTDNLSLREIAASGQVFTWHELERGRTDARYLISSGTKRCIASQKESMLTILTPSGANPAPSALAYWKHYLALDQDYGAILQSLPLTDEQLSLCSGIRVLSQDWWDTAVSFMISQNSNIPRSRMRWTCSWTQRMARFRVPASLRSFWLTNPMRGA